MPFSRLSNLLASSIAVLAIVLCVVPTSLYSAMLCHGVENILADLGLVRSLLMLGAETNHYCSDGSTPLIRAALHGHPFTVRRLVVSGASKNLAHRETKITPLIAAAMSGDLQTLRELKSPFNAPRWFVNTNFDEWPGLAVLAALKAGQLESAMELLNDSRDLPALILHAAASQGDMQILHRLCKRGCDVGQQYNDGPTPLLVAAERRHEALLQALLSIGSSRRCSLRAHITRLADGASPLHIAVEQCLSTSTFAGLVAAGCLVDARRADGRTPLHMAVASRECALSCTLALTSLGASVHEPTRGESGESVLFLAARGGNALVVRELVARGAAVESAHSVNGTTALMLATELGHFEVVKELVAQGANVNATRRSDGSNALMIAVIHEQTEIVRYLVMSGGADPTAHRRDGETPMSLAVRLGLTGSVRALLDLGEGGAAKDEEPALLIAARTCSDNVISFLLGLPSAAAHNLAMVRRASDGATALIVAAEAGCVESVRLLLMAEESAADDVNIVGKTALIAAAYSGQTQVITLLAESGANLNAAQSNGATALFVAAEHGYADAVRFLLQRGADPARPLLTGMTPLMAAAAKGLVSVVDVLLTVSAEEIGVSETLAGGETALYLAVVNDQVEVVRRLVTNGGAAVDSTMPDGSTPLFAAAHLGNVEVVRMLASLGADVNRCRHDKASPTYIAAEHGHSQVIKSLALLGANINAPNKNLATPVYIASQQGWFLAVRMLISLKADPNTRNRDGASPLFIAAAFGHARVIRELVLAGASLSTPTVHGTIAMDVAVGEAKILLQELAKADDVAGSRSSV